MINMSSVENWHIIDNQPSSWDIFQAMPCQIKEARFNAPEMRVH